MDAALWLVAGVVLLVAEIFTLTVAAGMVGVGALAAALAAALGAPVALQAGVFVVTSGGLLVFVREPVQQRLNRGGSSPSADPRALTGNTAVVVERVSETTGQVRLHGELWRARPYAGTGPVDAGLPVTVAAVEGATLLVYSPDLS
jgi:membrane protein implicated in regulation of membrane protease activity